LGILIARSQSAFAPLRLAISAQCLGNQTQKLHPTARARADRQCLVSSTEPLPAVLMAGRFIGHVFIICGGRHQGSRQPGRWISPSLPREAVSAQPLSTNQHNLQKKRCKMVTCRGPERCSFSRSPRIKCIKPSSNRRHTERSTLFPDNPSKFF